VLRRFYNVVDLHGSAAESGLFPRFSVVSPSSFPRPLALVIALLIAFRSVLAWTQLEALPQ